MPKNTNIGVVEHFISVIPLQVKQSSLHKSLPLNKTTVTPPDPIEEEPSVTPPDKLNSEYQQRVVNTTDLFGLTALERESKGHVKKRI